MDRVQKYLVRAGIAVPFLYFGTVVVSAWYYPGYSHVTQYASELGSAQAAHPALFNTGIFLAGLVAIAAGIGFIWVTTHFSNRRLLSGVAGASVAMFGISMLLGAWFPMPDPRHGGFGLGVAIHVAPFLLAAALRGQPGMRAINWFLVVVGVVMLVLFAISMGVGSLVTRANVGVFQRTYAFAVFSWLPVFAGYLLRRLSLPHATAGEPAR